MSTEKPHLIRLDNQEIRVIDRKLILGRHPGCNYVISINDKNNGISSRHAAVDVTGDIAWIEDLGSANGTYVRGKRITARTQLASGERFELDRLQFEFRAAVAKPQAPAPVRSAETTAALGIEELALPAPAPLQPAARPVKAAPPPPPPRPEPVVAPPPPVQEAAPAPTPVIAPPAVAAAPAEVVVPRTVEVPVLEAKAPPPVAAPPPAPVAAPEPVAPPPAPRAPAPEPVAAPPPPPAAAPSPSPAPKKVAGSWIDGPASDKTSLLPPGRREEVQGLMGAGGAVEAVSVPTLVFTVPEGRRVTLAQRDSATQEWTIGSNSDIEVSLVQEGLSGLHAKILRNGQTWTISDLMSANGTFVNGQKINRSHLESGNQLGFGPVLCTFLLPATAGAASPVAPKQAAPVKSKATGKQVALPLPLLLGGALLALALLGAVIYLLLR